MTAPICVYFGDASFWISTHWTPELIEKSKNKNSLVLNTPSKEAVKAAISQLEDKKLDVVIWVGKEAADYWAFFNQFFTEISAGGGLVKNEKGQYLFIMRRGFWDLPKGKLDEGETMEDCALREVVEETGLQLVELGSHLCDTYHVYREKGLFMLKKSVWYRMNADSAQGLTPQTEEQIEGIEWLSPNETARVLANTFPSIKDVLIASGDFPVNI